MRLRPSIIPRKTSLLFAWDYRDGWDYTGAAIKPVTVDGVAGTFTRAGVLTANDANGRVYSAPAGFPLIHSRNGVAVGSVFNAAQKQCCKQSENFGTTWSIVGTPTRTAAAARCGTVLLDLIGDDSAAGVEEYFQPITFTGNFEKGISIYVRQGTSTTTRIQLNDQTATTDRLQAHITWSAGLPVVNAAVGTYVGYEQLADANGNAVFRLYFRSTSVTAANTNNLIIAPACDSAFTVTLQGTIYAGGVMAVDDGNCGPYIATTTAAVTSAASTLTFPFAKLPAAMTVYVKFMELVSPTISLNDSYVFEIGSGADDTLLMQKFESGNQWKLYHFAAGADPTATVNTLATLGQIVEVRAVLNADGSVTLGISKDGGAESVNTDATTAPLPSAWSNTTLTINDGGGKSISAYQSVRIAPGVRTLAQMQAAV